MPVLLCYVDFTGAQPDPHVWQALCGQLRASMPGTLRTVSGPGYLAASVSNRATSPRSLRQESADHTLLVDCEREDSIGRAHPKTPHASIDITPGRVYLRRDWLGHRPLAYARVGDGLIVASYDHILLAHPSLSAGKFCDDYLLCYFGQLQPPLDRSVFADIQQVMPGADIVLTHNATHIDAEAPAPKGLHDRISDAQAIAEIRDSLENACVRSCEGAGRIGLSLSSGIDSTSVLAFLPQSMPRPLAITFGSSTLPEMDERTVARSLCEHFGLHNVSVEADLYVPMSLHGERPVFPGSPYSSMYRELKMALYRGLAAGGVDTVLGGYMGDELCANRSTWLIDALRTRRIGDIASNFRHLIAAGPRALWRDNGWRAAARRFFPRDPTPPPWLQPRWHDRYREILGAERSRFRAWPRPEQAANVFGGISALDGMESFFAERCGLEVRQTYADPDMIELMLTLPTAMSWRHGQYKWAVRNALVGRLPDHVRTAEKCGNMSRFYEAGCRQDSGVDNVCIDDATQRHLERFVRPDALRCSETPMTDWAVRSFGVWIRALASTMNLQQSDCRDGAAGKELVS